MNLIKTNFQLPADNQNNTWDAVRYWAGTSARLSQAALACQVMAGFALRELHAAHAVKPGRPAKLPNDLVIKSELSWPEIVKQETGISDETARNWMAMAEAVKARWKKLGVRDRVHALMSVPPSQWKEEEAQLVTDAVHKVTDGRTQLDFMRELGLAKLPQGNRDPKGGPKTQALSTDEQARLLRQMARENFNLAKKGIAASSADFFLLADANDTELEAQIAILEFAAQLRRAYVRTPKAQRGGDAVLAALKQAPW